MDIQINDTKQDRRKERLEAYMRFFELASKKGVTPYNISKNTGIATSTLSDWKNGDSMPKRDKIEKISDYLDVDADYIILGRKSTNTNKISKEQSEILDMYNMLDNDEKKQIISLLQLLIRKK